MDKLYEILKSTDLEVAYHHFNNPPPLPYIVYLQTGSDNFGADNRVYQKINDYQIELYSDYKDPETEQVLEDTLDNNGIFYDKFEDYIESEKLYMVAYQIQI